MVEPLVSVKKLTKMYRGRSWPAAKQPDVTALRGVNLSMAANTRLALVGASGSGKSTLARCIAGLEAPTSGEILFAGRKLDPASLHRRVQLIFQEPGASLNPRFSVAEALAEPLAIHGGRLSRAEVIDRLDQVGLSESVIPRRTIELSGGQKARLALARALAALEGGQENLLILDESLSSLDADFRAQILSLLSTLQHRRQLSYILIAHDLDLALDWADEVAVMYEGIIVERKTPGEIRANPTHPHARQLLACDSSRV